MRNILVTGGAGFIGSNLTLALQEKYPEARVTVLDD
ncbi:MAG: NAD-dependent epimerase/dehydratase family protein, partial [Candidatus Omnitrophica bacterium]|nr:NAD-dependent epimerase/dehydratase family protein [Candidatus Omnitrophota bacterium]